MKRYDISVTAWKEEDSKGEFVRFEDAQAEIERLNKACDQRAAHEYKLMGEIDALKQQNAELVAALQAMVGEYGEFYGDTPEVAAQSQSPLIKSALAAIAKARGDLT